jgi:uncharacterized protein (TIGR03382 family)
VKAGFRSNPPMLGRVTVVVTIGAALLPSAARATYSVVAADADAGEVGAAITSCVATLDVSIAYGSVPGAGAVLAQGGIDPQFKGRDQAAALLAAGTAPAQIVAAITDPAFDPGSALRQYGVVDLQGRAAGFTGSTAQDVKGDRQGTVAADAYSVQGNILTGTDVLDGTEAGFRSDGCDLAERLILGLEGGMADGGGDARCTPRGVPSDSVFLEVDRAGEDAGSFLRLSIQNTGSQNPVVLLRGQLDAWRMTHPCSTPAAPARSHGCSGSGGPFSAPAALAVGLLILSRRRRPSALD